MCVITVDTLAEAAELAVALTAAGAAFNAYSFKGGWRFEITGV